MKMYEQVKFIGNGSLSGRIEYATGLDEFIKHFTDNLMNSSAISYYKPIPLNSKTIKGWTTECARKACVSHDFKSKDIMLGNTSLLFIEGPAVRIWDCTLQYVPSGNSKYWVFLIRDETEQEIIAKTAEENKKKSFDISNVNIKYVTKVWIASDTGLKLPLNSAYTEIFQSFEEAKAFVEKMRKAWHMQMTLRGLTDKIVHDCSYALTVYKGNCRRKYISRFAFSISGKCTYANDPTPISTDIAA